jgi:hypothetical protein
MKCKEKEGSWRPRTKGKSEKGRGWNPGESKAKGSKLRERKAGE